VSRTIPHVNSEMEVFHTQVFSGSSQHEPGLWGWSKVRVKPAVVHSSFGTAYTTAKKTLSHLS
jgi:hypothetical protein